MIRLEMNASSTHAHIRSQANDIHGPPFPQMAVVGIGAKDEHSTTEHVAIADMSRARDALVEMLRLSV